VLDESAHQNLIAAIDMAISRCIDAYNMAAEAGEQELAETARDRVTDLKEFRRTVLDRPTRPARWRNARSPRGDARPVDRRASTGFDHRA